MLGVSLTDSEFINNAYQFAAECCERNKWIYAYIFFTPINDAKKKEEFDYAFGNYESFKEQMLKKLAVDLKIFIDDLVKRKDNQELTGHYLENRAMDFKVLKKEIVDFYTGTKKYQ